MIFGNWLYLIRFFTCWCLRLRFVPNTFWMIFWNSDHCAIHHARGCHGGRHWFSMSLMTWAKALSYLPTPTPPSWYHSSLVVFCYYSLDSKKWNNFKKWVRAISIFLCFLFVFCFYGSNFKQVSWLNIKATSWLAFFTAWQVECGAILKGLYLKEFCLPS